MASPRGHLIPGYRLTLGVTLSYVSLLIIIPFAALALKALSADSSELWSAVSGPRAVASYKLTLLAALAAATVNTVFGLLVAWILVKVKLPGHRLVDALIDMPFALPAAVGGIALTAVFGPHGWVGRFAYPLGLETAYSRLGFGLALLFVGFPYIVRSVQPVWESLDGQLEEAADTLGATPWQTFRRVIFPELAPALLTGFTLALARGIGEFGAVVFISGNIPMRTESSAQVIAVKLDQFDTTGAAAVALVMLAAAFLLLFLVNLLQNRSRRFQEAHS